MKTVFTVAMAISTIPIMAMLFVLFAYTMTQNDIRKNEIILSTQKTLLDSLDHTLDQTSKTISDISQNMDFLVFSNSSTRKRVVPRASQLAQTVRKQVFYHTAVAAIFFYNSECDYFYNEFKFNTLAYIRNDVSEIIKSETHACPSRQWFVQTIEGNPVLFYMLRDRYGTMLVAVDPALDDNYKNIADAADQNSTWYFKEPDGGAAQTQVQTNGQNLTISASPVAADLLLVYTEKEQKLLERIDFRQMVMLIIIIVLIFLVPGIWIIINITLLRPLGNLAQSIDKIRNGDLDHRAAVTGRIQELRIFATSFNSMMDSLKQVRLESYEHQLTASRARLQYLQLQIRPHFYLNCLKNMYSLLDLHDYEKIRKMILALSAYFAHSFRDVKNFVTVLDELNACTSYLDLQNIVAHRAELAFNIESRCVNAQCLPMSVLTFVENCIKHGTPDRLMHIEISARMRADDNEEMLWITVSDDGGGFSEEALKTLNGYDPSEIVYRHEKIGISNVCYRLWLIYREKAHVAFRNENDRAIVEICMPYETKED